MGATTDPIAAAATICFFCTFAILAMTYVWARSNRCAVRVRPRLVGRAAAPYWHSPTGRQDERGIGALRGGDEHARLIELRHPDFPSSPSST